MRRWRFRVKDVDLAGRIGELETPRGVLETPTLLPVIDPLRQEVPASEVASLGFRAVITNAYLLYRRNAGKPVDVHKAIGFDGIVMTDSGAYQLLEYGRVDVDNRTIIEYEKAIGSDIAVILDVPSGARRGRREAEEAVRATLERAREALKYIDEERLWVLPVQGGPYVDLVEASARESAKLAEYYDVYALGSPTVLLERYRYAELMRLVVAARRLLPRSKPLHLFGAGHPMVIPFAVALGVDLFDSASYILYARDERYMTLTHTYRLNDMDYFPCSCPVCSRYTPRDLMEMPRLERVRLLALHNLHVLAQAIREVKLAIREGRLWELLVERSRGHPSLRDALKVIEENVEWIERFTPYVKGGEVHGIFLYGSSEDASHPRVREWIRRLRSNYRPRWSSEPILVPVDPRVKPFTATKEYRVAKKLHPGSPVIGYLPALALIPEELSETYPATQHEQSEVVERSLLEKTAEVILELLSKWSVKPRRVYYSSSIPWSRSLAELVAGKLGLEAEELPVKR